MNETALDKVLEAYRDMFGVKTERANELHRDAWIEVAMLRAQVVGLKKQRDGYKLTIMKQRDELAAKDAAIEATREAFEKIMREVASDPGNRWCKNALIIATAALKEVTP